MQVLPRGRRMLRVGSPWGSSRGSSGLRRRPRPTSSTRAARSTPSRSASTCSATSSPWPSAPCPLDAFYKGLTGTFSYTYHFNDSWAWEIVGFTYSSNFWTGLKDELEQQWKVKPVNIPELNYFGDSNLVWKPLYGKLASFNRALIYGEFFFTVGPAIAKYTTPGAYLGGNVGIGFRVHLSKYFSTRLDVRYYRFQRLDRLGDNDDVLFIQLGLSLNIH